MSCPAQNAPIHERLRSLDEDISLPPSFYLMTILMVATVISIPLLYRRIWLFLFDLVSDVRNDLKLPDRPAGCRKVGRSGTRDSSKDRQPEIPIPLFAKDQNVDSSGPANGKLEPATATPSGLGHDRLFYFAQQTTSLPDPESHKVTSTWVGLNQQSHPRLALIKTELWLPDPDAPDYDEDSEWVQSGGCVVMQFPFTQDIDRSRNGLRALLGLLITRLRARSYSAEPIAEFRLPLHPSEKRMGEKRYRLEKMKISREETVAWNMEPEIPYNILTKLKFHLGLSNPVTIFRLRETSAHAT
jgi:hypothetical protein